MKNIFERIEELELCHDKPSEELIEKHDIKLGLRNKDGSGVVVGITSKGQVIGYKKLPKEQGFEISPVEGRLLYCGYDVSELVENVLNEKREGFDEMTYLLLAGELPSKEDLGAFSKTLAERRQLPGLEKKIIMDESVNNDQMSALHVAITNLHRFDSNPNSRDIKDITNQCIDIIAKFPTIVSYNYSASGKGLVKELIEPRQDLSTAQNFLYMLTGNFPDKAASKIFDLCLMLHAEHGGGNNSTFTVRTVSSSGANTYMAISSGIASLSGHLHGGANEVVMKMIDDLKVNVKDPADEEEVLAYLKRVLSKEAGDRSGKIYGIGHAVYTKSDPRAIILEKEAQKLAEKTGRQEEFRLYQAVARLSPPLLTKEKGKVVSPNVDFYSGFVYECLGIPREIFTPIFAMSRVTGWCAHRIEQIIQGRIIRPAYVSSITQERTYVPLNKRQ